MRRKIIAGNWKMFGDLETAKALFSGLLDACDAIDYCDIVVFPPFIYLPSAANRLASSHIFWGAQNVCLYSEGAYTGEISAAMLKDCGCTHVIVGHSERRAYFAESNDVVGEKCKTALRHGLTPIICVGERLEDRNKGVAEQVVQAQIDAILSVVGGVSAVAKSIFAYEPVWAIGTGMAATPETAQNMHAFIRSYLATYDEKISSDVRILYGGSVKADNARQLFAMSDIDGALVGGASRTVNEFVGIAKCSK